jgi:EmrB/QacA subfamily drug resistance transporter
MKYTSLQRNVLLVSALSNFLTPFMASSVVVALPRLGRDLSMNVMTLTWVSTAYLLTAGAFLVPFGRISDIYGRKRIFLCGIVLDNCASLIGAFSPSSGVLLVARLLQGMGGAMIFGTGLTLVSSVFPASSRGKAFGTVIGAAYAGLSTGPFIGGFLTDQLGWRSIFLSNVVIGMTILVVTLWKLKQEWAEARGEKFDLGGALLYIASLVAVMYALSIMPGFSAFALAAGGCIGLACFISWELRLESPVLDMRLFQRSRTFLFSNLAALINYSATFAITFLMSLYLQYIRGFTPQVAGLILVSQPVTQALLSPLAGRLSDRTDPRLIASAGMTLTMIGLGFLSLLGGQTRLVYIVSNLLLLGCGFALFSSPNTNAIMGAVEKKYLGIASGMVATMRLIGQMLSMGAVMLILAFFHLSGVRITPAYHSTLLRSTRAAFLVFTLTCLAGIFASLARGRRELAPAPVSAFEDSLRSRK